MQIGWPFAYTQVNSDAKVVLRDIATAFENTHGGGPGFEYLKDSYENYYDIAIDEGYDKALGGIPSDPHAALVHHERVKAEVKYYPDLLKGHAVNLAEQLCEAVMTLYRSKCTQADQDAFRSVVRDWNMDTGCWIDVSLEGDTLNITWRHTWCQGA